MTILFFHGLSDIPDCSRLHRGCCSSFFVFSWRNNEILARFVFGCKWYTRPPSSTHPIDE